MDVDQAHFRGHLFQILKHLADAKFITFDLEMSGISTRPKYSTGSRAPEIGKLTLEESYEAMKSAAEKYQVLQVGITCVSEDENKEYYLARPYNFTLSPLQADGVDLGLGRNFTFSTSACGFLTKNGFDFAKLFTTGVTYLSRNEEIELVEEYEQRAEKNSSIPDIVVAVDDHKTLGFLRSVRKVITAWVNDPKPEFDYVNVCSCDSSLNGYQKRLVHQLLSKEFPTLRARSRMEGAFMQVEKYDEDKGLANERYKLASFKSKMAEQKGLRWIFEALTGGDLSGIDPEWFCRGLSIKESIAIKDEFDKTVDKLRDNGHIIVGHNLFYDLGFFYKTFVGALPLKLEHFQKEIHELFPVIVDTKYLAMHGAGESNKPTLKKLLAPFRKFHVPLIVLHEDHTLYGAEGRSHEAGYDSWMTAELFVKLGAKLYSAWEEMAEESDSNSNYLSARDYLEHQEVDGGVSLLVAPPPAPTTAPSPNPSQWLPEMSDPFWDIYANKLCVSTSEAGVLDLE